MQNLREVCVWVSMADRFVEWSHIRPGEVQFRSIITDNLTSNLKKSEWLNWTYGIEESPFFIFRFPMQYVKLLRDIMGGMI